MPVWQWILGIVRSSYDLIDHGNSLSVPVSGIDVALSALYFVAMTLAELRMIYRLWRVQQQQWAVVLVPFFMCLAGLASGIIAIHCARGTTPSEDCSAPTAAPWMVSALVLIAAANIYCSATLLYTLWDVRRAVERVSNAFVHDPVTLGMLVLLIESNLLVTASSLAVMTAFVADCHALLPSINIAGPLVGIAFCLMRLARSGERWDKVLPVTRRLAPFCTKPPDVRLASSV
ncbi:hypothetical protein PsYK624_130400 [Phanerochaete sordida]|uniref:Uncharacterized protein n=1 Tax=Phanerochaete sordida TaxID=48140 RepID=A0A9P3GKY9_9APHY|nr:hypothetical protein PsYK624_130400 [Phanerochaete sordida]